MTDDEFTTLLEQNEWLLYHIGYTFAKGNREDLRDLYQEMVCNLWSNRRQYQGDCSPKNWMYRVALNTAISLWRKESRKPQFIPLPEELEQQRRDEPDNPLLNELYQLIDLLPKADRALIYLYIDGVSETEMASILGISPSSVGVRIHRIKQKLRDLRNKSWKTS